MNVRRNPDRRQVLRALAGACCSGFAANGMAQVVQTPAPRGDDVTALAKQLRQARWSPERAYKYMAPFGPVKGCNYVPADASNIWLEENEKTVDRELGWAQYVSLNSIRVFLTAPMFQEMGDGLYTRIDRLLSIAAKHQISVMPTLVAQILKDPGYNPGDHANEKIPDPPFLPGVHGGPRRPRPDIIGYRKNMEAARLVAKEFVQGVLRQFGKDKRIIGWDLFNEPKLEDRPMVEHVFACAREADPMQPLSACWQGEDLSDIYNFHTYGRPGWAYGSEPDLLPFDVEMKQAVDSGRPLICTECLARTFGNTFEAFLPYFSQHHAGWYVWGLCAGTAQHHYPWRWPVGAPEPKDWFHCILYPDGSPYRDREIEMIRTFEYAGEEKLLKQGL